jgi:hypothetical protein
MAEHSVVSSVISIGGLQHMQDEGRKLRRRGGSAIDVVHAFAVERSPVVMYKDSVPSDRKCSTIDCATD